jgi:hypothetical protein
MELAAALLAMQIKARAEALEEELMPIPHIIMTER